MTTLEQVTSQLVAALEGLRFDPPVAHVYNPLVYASEPHAAYLERFGGSPHEVLLLGMNPGPWGMAQTGVPFGDVGKVREFLGIEAPVGRPEREHRKRPVMGFLCTRGEVSGQRMWTWAEEKFGTPERFFETFFVANYCPLCFLEASGRNRTPDRLPKPQRLALFEACDEALRETVLLQETRLVVGVGRFAERRAKEVLADLPVQVGRMLHPSPASPAANRGWAKEATRQLRELGVEVP